MFDCFHAHLQLRLHVPAHSRAGQSRLVRRFSRVVLPPQMFLFSLQSRHAPLPNYLAVTRQVCANRRHPSRTAFAHEPTARRPLARCPARCLILVTHVVRRFAVVVVRCACVRCACACHSASSSPHTTLSPFFYEVVYVRWGVTFLARPEARQGPDHKKNPPPRTLTLTPNWR